MVKVKHELQNRDEKNLPALLKSLGVAHLLGSTTCSKAIVSQLASKTGNFPESPYACGSLTRGALL